jgi:hypothetical protein
MKLPNKCHVRIAFEFAVLLAAIGFMASCTSDVKPKPPKSFSTNLE